LIASEPRPLGAILYERGFDVDELVLQCCADLRARGLRIGGTIQKAAGDRGQCAASVHVVDLRSGETFDIWEHRGACARGCRLNERGLVDVEPSIIAAIAEGVDLVVVNRFGRAESLGRGLIGCFTAALEAGVPLLTAVRAPYGEAWQTFQAGLAKALPPDLETIVDWALMRGIKFQGPRRPEGSGSSISRH
jgi:hypothetical protein